MAQTHSYDTCTWYMANKGPDPFLFDVLLREFFFFLNVQFCSIAVFDLWCTDIFWFKPLSCENYRN